MKALGIACLALLASAGCATAPPGNTDPWITEWEAKAEEVRRAQEWVAVNVRNGAWQDVTVRLLTPAVLRVGLVTALREETFRVKRAWIAGRRVAVELDPVGGNPVRLYLDIQVPESVRSLEIMILNRLEQSSVSAAF